MSAIGTRDRGTTVVAGVMLSTPPTASIARSWRPLAVWPIAADALIEQ
jgi:hypothetical protein